MIEHQNLKVQIIFLMVQFLAQCSQGFSFKMIAIAVINDFLT